MKNEELKAIYELLKAHYEEEDKKEKVKEKTHTARKNAGWYWYTKQDDDVMQAHTLIKISISKKIGEIAFKNGISKCELYNRIITDYANNYKMENK